MIEKRLQTLEAVLSDASRLVRLGFSSPGRARGGQRNRGTKQGNGSRHLEENLNRREEYKNQSVARFICATAKRVQRQRDMECNERARRLAAYNRAALALSIAVDDLLQGVGVISRMTYDIRRHTAARARIGFEAAMRAYEVHMDEHGCGAGIFDGTKVVKYTVIKTSASWARSQFQR